MQPEFRRNKDELKIKVLYVNNTTNWKLKQSFVLCLLSYLETVFSFRVNDVLGQLAAAQLGS